MRDRRTLAQVVRELNLSRPERRAATAERRAERAMRQERDAPREAELLAAALEAERRRHQGFSTGG